MMATTYFRVEDLRLLLEDDVGLAAAAFFAGAFVVLVLAAVFAFAAGVFPITAFFAESRREVAVAFFAVVALDLLAAGFTAFLVVAFGLELAALVEVALDFVAVVALVNFEAAGFLTAGFAAAGLLVFLVVRVVDLLAMGLAALDAVDLAFVAAAGLATLEAGLFSLASDASALVAFLAGSLTRPEGPLGNTRVPLSAPVAIALLSWVSWALPISTL